MPPTQPMSNSDCIFCSIVTGKIPCIRIWQDDLVLAFLDIGPVSDGHTLVIPKAHFGRLHECSPDVLVGVSNCIGKIAQAVVSAVGAEAYNVLCNNGIAAGQLVEHVHFILFPETAATVSLTAGRRINIRKAEPKKLPREFAKKFDYVDTHY